MNDGTPRWHRCQILSHPLSTLRTDARQGALCEQPPFGVHYSFRLLGCWVISYYGLSFNPYPKQAPSRMNAIDSIYQGDCRELLSSLADESIDLVVTSPPYNLGKEYEIKTKLDRYVEEQSAIIKECVRVLKSTGSLFWQVGSYSESGMLIPLDIRFFPVLESYGMLPRNRIAWIRQHGLHARNKFSARYETILWFTKSHDYKFFLDNVRVPQKYRNKKYHKGDNHGQLSCNPAGKNPGDLWAFRNVKHNHEEQTIHPCQFPEDLVSRIILSTTECGDAVLDPYMGTGTVAVVARNHDRHFAGAELDLRYHQVACRRLDGLPDENGSFPNLKTLRDYAERNGLPAEAFTFDVQKSRKPTDRAKSKVHAETHHLEELFRRTAYEEEDFAANLRDEPAPSDYFKGGQVMTPPSNPSKQANLFTEQPT